MPDPRSAGAASRQVHSPTLVAAPACCIEDFHHLAHLRQRHRAGTSLTVELLDVRVTPFMVTILVTYVLGRENPSSGRFKTSKRVAQKPPKFIPYVLACIT